MKKLGFIAIASAALSFSQLKAFAAPTNGDLEDFQVGFPVGWTYDGPGSSPPSIENTQITSPFTNVYSKSTASIALTGAFSSSQLHINFAPTGAFPTTVNFDFMYGSGSGTTGLWDISIQGPLGDYGGSYGYLDYIDYYIGGSGSEINGESVLKANTWYNIQFVFNEPNAYGSPVTEILTPDGGESVVTNSYAESSFTPGNNNIENIGIYDYDFSDSGANNPTLYLDNFAVGTDIAPAPEPSAFLLLGITISLFYFKIRISRRRCVL